MSNELVKSVNPLDLINKQNEVVATSGEAAELAKIFSLSYLPTLSVAYGTSDAVTSGKARPGDFVLASQTCLGSEVEVVYLAYRYKGSEWDIASKQFGDSAYHLPSNGSMDDNEGWQAFCRKSRPRTIQVSEGLELLIYLPKLNVHCLFFMKGTLKSGSEALLAAKAGRLCKVKTRLHKNKGNGNISYPLDVTPTNRCIVGSNLQVPGTSMVYDVEIPNDLLTKAFDLFIKLPKSPKPDDTPDIDD